MGKPSFGQVAIGAALLLVSCGGSSGQTGTAGNGGGGRAGNNAGGGAGGGAGGQAGSTDGGGASCGAVSACGGNLVGTWRVTQSCVTATQDLSGSSGCPGATAELEFAIGGTVTFNADGTYSSMPTGGNATVHEHFPSGCMPFGFTCAQLAQSAMDAGTTTNCSIDSAGGCNCDGTVPETATSQAGTYSTSGSTMNLMHDGGTSSAPYCVQGNLLYEMSGPSDGGLMGMGGIVLTRQ